MTEAANKKINILSNNKFDYIFLQMQIKYKWFSDRKNDDKNKNKKRIRTVKKTVKRIIIMSRMIIRIVIMRTRIIMKRAVIRKIMMMKKWKIQMRRTETIIIIRTW